MFYPVMEKVAAGKKNFLKRPKRKEKKKKFHRQTFIFFLAAMAGWLADDDGHVYTDSVEEYSHLIVANRL